MRIQLDHSSGRAVYQQIIDHVKREVALGRARPGEKLPTVRELAAELVINPNTIAKAYKQLEQAGVIVTRPGAGAFVAEMDSQLNASVKRRIVCEQLERTVVDAIHMQIGEGELRDWMDKTLEKFEFDGDTK